MKSRERVIAPRVSFNFAGVVILAGLARSALKAPSAMACSVPQAMMCLARSAAVSAVARVAVPRAIKHCETSLHTFPSSLRKMCFDMTGFGPLFFISVISVIMLPPHYLHGGDRAKL